MDSFGHIMDNTELRVLHVGGQRERRDYRYQRQSFEFYGLEYVIRGSGYFESRGVRQALAGGSVDRKAPKVMVGSTNLTETVSGSTRNCSP